RGRDRRARRDLRARRHSAGPPLPDGEGAMTLLLALAVGIAGGIGAALRYLVDNSVPERLRARYPWGIALVNLTGSFALGIVTALLPGVWLTIIGTGLLGGYTTFSTAAVDA